MAGPNDPKTRAMMTTTTIDRTLSALAPTGGRCFAGLLLELPCAVFEGLHRRRARVEGRHRIAGRDHRLPDAARRPGVFRFRFPYQQKRKYRVAAVDASAV